MSELPVLVSHREALVYALFPEGTDYITLKKGLFTKPVLKLWYGLEDLPLPSFRFASDQVGMKVLLPSDTTPRKAAAFWKSLHRSLTMGVMFDLVAERGRAYFQIKCAPEDRQSVEQQLLLYFPGSVVEPNDLDMDELETMGWCRYYEPLVPNKTLSDFRLDPYAQWLAFVDQLPDDRTVILRFMCAPVPEQTITHVLRTATGDVHALAGQQWGIRPFQARQDLLPSMIKLLEGRLPAWAVTCAV